MNCEQIEQSSMMRSFLNGGLSDDVKREFQGHVSACESCRADLQMAASLMLQEPVPERRVLQEANEAAPSLWASLREWLFPSGVQMWQPALAFAAVLVVAVPMLKMAWFPADVDVSQYGTTTYRAGQSKQSVNPLESQLKGAIGALHKGEAQQAFSMLDSQKVNWDRGRMENVFTAYRVRARAAAELGWSDAALQDLNRAMSFAELDPDKVACVEKDMAAVAGSGEFCTLPAVADIH